MIVERNAVELERGLGPRGQHHPRAVVLVDRERLAVAAAPDFELVVALGEVVRARIEREQHPYPTLSVSAQYDDVAVLGGAEIHPGVLAAHEVVVGAEPNLDRRIAGRCDGCRGLLSG